MVCEPAAYYEGFIAVSLPLREDLFTAQIECVLGAERLPLPGEGLDDGGGELMDFLVAAAADSWAAAAYARHGFTVRHRELQMVVDLPRLPGRRTAAAAIWPDYGIPADRVDDVLELLSTAAADTPRGTLTLDPQPWTRERLSEAKQRIRVRGTRIIATAFSDEHLDSVNVESRALVVEQMIAMLQWYPNPKTGLPDVDELAAFTNGLEESPAAGAAESLLSWEYEQRFGLDFARSYADASLESDIDRALQVHAERIRQLQAALAPLGDVPQPAVAYQPTAGELPSDAASAYAFIHQLAEADSSRWTSAASENTAALHGENDAAHWRHWLIEVAAQSRSLKEQLP